jgi:hypothetical protein
MLEEAPPETPMAKPGFPAAPWLLRANDEHAPRAVAAGLVAAPDSTDVAVTLGNSATYRQITPTSGATARSRLGSPEPVAASNAQVFALIAEGRHRVDHRSVQSSRAPPPRRGHVRPAVGRSTVALPTTTSEV